VCALSPPTMAAVQFETDGAGLSRLSYSESGWCYYTWRTHRCHYVVHGSGPPVVLVHGFGANAYHWRYNIAELSKTNTVYCVCLLGFGWSDKAIVDYSLEMWGSQISDFIRDVVGAPAVIAGNSIGAVTVLSAAFTDPALVRGVVLLNAAGRFDADVVAVQAPTQELFLSEILKRIASFVIFISTKFRIGAILRTVYVDHSKVDAQLVESIYRPACDPDALEAFFLISGSGGRSKRTLNELLRGCQPLPMLLLWGNQDPWMKNDKAQKILELYGSGATLINVATGSHCPHDDAPAEVNAALLQWMKALPA